MRPLPLFGLLALISLVPLPSTAAKRTDDLVALQNEKFVIEYYSVCELKRPASFGPLVKFQVHGYSEAPARGVISRDRFVAMETELSAMLRIGFVTRAGLPASQAFSALECRGIDAPIGSVDLEIKLFVTKDGVQIETTDTATGKTSRVTDTWDD